MITEADLSKQSLIDSLNSLVCPACGERKIPKKTLCYPCYGGLPGSLRTRLYSRVGEGYEAAVADSLKALGSQMFHK